MTAQIFDEWGCPDDRPISFKRNAWLCLTLLILAIPGDNTTYLSHLNATNFVAYEKDADLDHTGRQNN